MSEKSTGQCLCGAVRFEFDGAPAKVGFCHCKMCRRWSGGAPFTAFHAAVRLLAEDSLRWRKSSKWGERGFCGECGTPLFWRAADMPEWGVSAGALDDERNLTVGRHIYIDEKPDFYDFVDDAPRFTGAQFIAKTLAEATPRSNEELLQNTIAKIREQKGDDFADEVVRMLALLVPQAQK